MKPWPLILAACLAPAALWGTSGSATASRATCLLQSELVILQYKARGFLDFLDTGRDSGRARELRHWMEDHPAVPLRMKMRRAGMEAYETLTMRVITQQKGLLEVYRIKGLDQAGISAQRLGAQALLEGFADRIIPLPCDFVPQRDLPGETATGMGRLRTISRDTAIASSLIALLVSGAGLFLAERLARKHQRRKQRYPCALVCSLQCGKLQYQAKLVDISRLGAKLRVWHEDGQPLPDTKEDVTITATGTFSLDAQITWKNTDYIGLKFSERLSEQDLHALLKLPPAGSIPQQPVSFPA